MHGCTFANGHMYLVAILSKRDEEDTICCECMSKGLVLTLATWPIYPARALVTSLQPDLLLQLIFMLQRGIPRHPLEPRHLLFFSQEAAHLLDRHR